MSGGASGRDKALLGGSAVVLVIVAVVIGLAVWKASDSDDVTLPAATNAPSSRPSTGSPALGGDAAAKAIAAYKGYWAAYVAAAAKPDGGTPELAKYVADPLLTQLRLTLRNTRDLRIIYQGHPKWTPRVTAVDTSKAPYTVTIEDCFDSAGWKPIFIDSGKSAAAPGQATRYLITSTVKSFDVKGWLVVESQADRSRSC